MTQSDIINNNFSKAFECIKCSNAYDTGEVLSEEKLFKQISERKHSTFDLSKFSVVGSPTITDDGVVSGISASNYLTFPLNINPQNTLKIQIEGVHGDTQTSAGTLFHISDGTTSLTLYRNRSSKMSGEVGSTSKTYLGDSAVTTNGARYKYVVSFDIVTNKYSYLYYENDVLITQKDNILISVLANMNWSNITIGNIGQQYSPLNGSIDLKQFSITVDGKEVFSGNKTGIDVINDIEIPYTLSKTGSKIVNVAYRDRVIDLYEQEGQAGYYTIDEPNKNFTLPMGEIYGMIGGSSSTGGSGLEICDIGMALYVDETKGLRRYLNGQIVDINSNTQAFLNRLKQITTLHPSLLCTEDEWQTAKTMSKLGQCGKFVFNYGSDGITVVSVRLPAVVNINGLVDMNNAGLIKDESLPNIKDVFRYYPMSAGDYNDYTTSTGLIKGAKVPSFTGGVYAREVTRDCGISFDASRVSSTYQDNAPVQQEAIQYPYFIQIATGSETEANIVNTLENVNGFTLLESKYSDKPLYNESWLLSNGQWNAKSVYPTVYEGLQVEYNSEIEAGTTVTLPSGVSYTKRGLSVKLSTETYTDYDFVLNTADETFRLPLKTKLASGKAVVGNGKALMLTNGTQTGALSACGSGASGNVAGFLRPVNGADNINIGDTAETTAETKFVTDKAIGIVSDPTKSGIELSNSGLYLYFYVGETVQNANLIDAGRIGEQLANKQDVLEYKMVDSYVNGTSGYNVWKTPLGYYCEQWGRFGSSDGVDTTVTFLKTFKDTNYLPMVGQQYGNQGSGQFRTFNIYTIRTNSMVIHNTTNGWNTCIWQASGYLAEGEYNTL